MVVANSTWVRPAQALIYSESGEVRYFPPRNRGGLPRALTFGDHQDWRHHASQLNGVRRSDESQVPFEFSEHIQDQDSYLITSQSENFHIEDPPDEYTSFESEYSRHSIARDVYLYTPRMDQEAPSMSTPTEQYIKKVLKRKGPPHQSVLSSKQQPCMSSASDTQNGCMSPLLQSESGPCLSLDDLVDLYAKKLEAARASRSSKVGDPNNDSDSISAKEQNMLENPNAKNYPFDRMYDDGDNNSEERDLNSNTKSQNICAVKTCQSLQLSTFDIQLFLEKLEDGYLGQEKNAQYEEDWLCVSSEELESILLNCCKETIEFVMMDR